MEAVADLVRDGLLSAVLWAVPLAAAAVLAGVAAGLLAARFGVADPAVGLVARAVAVVVALLLVAGNLATDVTTLGQVAFGRLAALGRGTDAASP